MSNSSSSGIVGVITIIFVILKLIGTIDWSWWWVLSPIWIGAAFSIVFLLIFFIVGAIFDRD